MSQPLSNRGRVLAVLRGERPDRVPFTIYEWKIPWGYDKRRLCERGLVMMQRFPGFRVAYPNCELTTLSYAHAGRTYERESIKTPRGEVSSLFLPGTTCNVRKQIEYWIKDEADYEPLTYMAEHAEFCPAYDEIEAARQAIGEDGVVYLWPGYSPLQEIMLQLIGLQNYAYHLADCPDRLWALYDALRERNRRKYAAVAHAPVDVIQVCANPTACFLGRATFVNRILPCVEEACQYVHAAGKLASIHVDGDNALWAADLAASSVDIIEAFTPAPDTDMTAAQGRAAFGDKILWLNFPSSLHLATADTIRATTHRILEAVQPSHRFLMGVTEDLPPWAWRTSLNAIQDSVDGYRIN